MDDERYFAGNYNMSLNKCYLVAYIVILNIPSVLIGYHVA
jgi:hypothetical protein